MKGKKEYLLLALLIVALSLYLVFRKTGQTNYELPQLPEIKKEDVTRLEIRKGDSAVNLERQGDRWVILPEGYPADSTLIDGMLGALISLKLTALASEAGSYAPYDLDETKRIQASLYNGEKLLRTVDIGKAAPSSRHTFVKLADDKNVYHAAESFRSKLDKDAQALRDKQVLKVEGEVSEMLLAGGGKSLHIVRNVEPAAPASSEGEATAGTSGGSTAASTPAAASATGKPATAPTEGKPEAPKVAAAEPTPAGESEGEEAPPPPPAPKWVTEDGKQVKEKDIDTLVSTFTNLKCDAFVDGKKKEDLKNPSFTVSLKGNKDYEFSVFDQEGAKYVCTSSESEYPFLLPEWRVKKIKVDLDGLIEK